MSKNSTLEKSNWDSQKYKIYERTCQKEEWDMWDQIWTKVEGPD